jgi:hypothetical protein
MNNMTCGVLFCVVALATPVVHGGQEAPGVAGVDVIVKQNPTRRDVTNSWGIFALEPLPAGTYTLTFKARPAKNLVSWDKRTSDNVVVASEYLIKIEGAKSSVNRSGLNSDKLLAGVDIAVEVGPGAKVRGQVLVGASKKWVWVPKRVGSNMQGHWAIEGSQEASAHNVLVVTPGRWIFR